MTLPHAQKLFAALSTTAVNSLMITHQPGGEELNFKKSYTLIK